MTTKDQGDLGVAEDLKFQERSWKVQRLGWGVMTVIVLMALAGLLGDGPVSYGSRGGDIEGLEIEFQRFNRRSAPQTLSFHLNVPPDAEGKVKLLIDREYLQSIRLESIVPEPDAVQGGRNFHTFEFSTSDAATVVTVKMLPEAIGWVNGKALIEGRPPVVFRQFVYP